jgi:hypothetical protein
VCRVELPPRGRLKNVLGTGAVCHCIRTVVGAVRAMLGNWKDAVSTLQAVVTIVAILVGGVWTWYLFDPIAQRKPNLSVVQSLSARKLADGLLLLDATFSLHNSGKVTLFISCADFWVRRVLPLTQEQTERFRKTASDIKTDVSDTDWPVLKWARKDFNTLYEGRNFLVEAGGDAPFELQFVIPASVGSGPGNQIATVQLYSNFQMADSATSPCKIKPDNGIAGPGWPTSALYDLRQ